MQKCWGIGFSMRVQNFGVLATGVLIVLLAQGDRLLVGERIYLSSMIPLRAAKMQTPQEVAEFKIEAPDRPELILSDECLIITALEFAQYSSAFLRALRVTKFLVEIRS